MPSPATISCTRCNGTGEYRGTRRDGSSYIGACFNCRPSAWRANVRYHRPAAATPSPARIRGLNRANRHVETFALACPAEHAWLVANAPTVNFAASLLSGIARYGNLTPRQLEAVRRNLTPSPAERGADGLTIGHTLVGTTDVPYAPIHPIGTGIDGRPVTEAQVLAGAPVSLSSLVPQRTARSTPTIVSSQLDETRTHLVTRTSDNVVTISPPPRPTIDAAAMRAALLAARTSGLRKPRLTLGLFEFRLGRVGTDRAETIFVYTRHAIRSLNWSFAGSIRADDVWFAASVRYGNPSMSDEQMALIRDAAANPRNAAAAHGHDTTHCSCCRRLLTDPPSVMAGIGPVCIRRFGWL